MNIAISRDVTARAMTAFAALVIGVLASILFVQSASADTIVGSGPGTCTSGALENAMAGGGIITFNCGGPATLTVSTTHAIGSPTIIDGLNGGNPIILTGAPNLTILYTVASGHGLTLTNLTISNTYVGAYQMIYNTGGTVSISNVNGISNTGMMVYSSSGTVTIINSQFSGNSGTVFRVSAAGVSPDVLSIDHSLFVSNTNGPTIYGNNANTTVNLSDTEFDWSTSQGGSYGGAVHVEGSNSDLNITGSRFMSNTTGYGGAIYQAYGAMTISNSLFYSNTGTAAGAIWIEAGQTVKFLSSTLTLSKGGGLHLNGGNNSPFIIADSTISFNEGGLYDGGMGIGGQSLTVTHSSFTGNHSASGTGALASSGSTFISDTVFTGNVGVWAGALSMSSGTSAIYQDAIYNTKVLSNTATGHDGGGIYASQPLILSGATISGNVSTAGSGGGLAFWSPGQGLTVTDSLFAFNVAGGTNNGGGVQIQGIGLFTNTTLYSNTAYTGGGVFIYGTPGSYFQNVTAISNTATNPNGSYGGDIYNAGFYPLYVRNTIIAGGSPNNCKGTVTSLGNNISSDLSCLLTAALSDAENIDPRLGPFQNTGGATSSLVPYFFSPAVNRGNNASCPTTDQRGLPRPVQGACDIGATEYQGFAGKVYVPAAVK